MRGLRQDRERAGHHADHALGERHPPEAAIEPRATFSLSFCMTLEFLRRWIPVIWRSARPNSTGIAGNANHSQNFLVMGVSETASSYFFAAGWRPDMKRWLALLMVWWRCRRVVAAEDAAQTLRDRGAEFCFGRVYNSAHLARNKRQNLSGAVCVQGFFQRSAQRRQAVHARAIDRDRAKSRAADRSHHSALSRWPFQALRTALATRPAAARSIARPTAKSSPRTRWISPAGDKLIAMNGLDDKVTYQLERLPLSACQTWRDRARPEWVGKGQPLACALPSARRSVLASIAISRNTRSKRSRAWP